jgi:hypothetical protein
MKRQGKAAEERIWGMVTLIRGTACAAAFTHPSIASYSLPRSGCSGAPSIAPSVRQRFPHSLLQLPRSPSRAIASLLCPCCLLTVASSPRLLLFRAFSFLFHASSRSSPVVLLYYPCGFNATCMGALLLAMPLSSGPVPVRSPCCEIHFPVRLISLPNAYSV